MIIKNFINKSEVADVKNWISLLHSNNIMKTNPKDTTRFSLRMMPGNNTPTEWNRANEPIIVPAVVKNIKTKLMDRFNLHTYEDKNDRDLLINYFLEGATLEKHRHVYGSGNRKNNEVEIRCNILVSRPNSGGLLIVDNKTQPQDEGDLVIFNALLDHEVTKVEGKTPRMVISFGFDIPINIFRNLKC